MPVTTLPNGPGWTYSQAEINADMLLQVAAAHTQLTNASNNVNVSGFVGSGTLSVDSTAGFASSGTLYVDTTGGPGNATITYTAITGNSFTGCTTTAGAGYLYTSGNVEQAAVTSYRSQSQYCCVQLQDGTGIILVAWSGYYYLLGTVLGKTGVQVLASQQIPDSISGAFALCIDTKTPQQNLYVCRGYNGVEMYLWKWSRSGTNNAWTVAATGNSTQADAEQTVMNMIWSADDGSGAGHLLIATENTLVTFDAGTLVYAHGYSASEAPTACAVSAGYSNSPDVGLGATCGLFVQTGGSSVQAQGWSLSSGVLTLSTARTIDSSTTLPADDVSFAPHVRYVGDDTWFVMYPNYVGNLIAQAVYAAGGGEPAVTAGAVPAPSIAGIAHYVPNGRGAEVGSYAEFQFIANQIIAGGSETQTYYAWVVTRVPGNATILQRQIVQVTPGSSASMTWGLIAFQVASGMDGSSTSVVSPGEPQVTQVDVVIGTVPGAVNTFALSGTAVQPAFQPAAPALNGTYGQIVAPGVAVNFPFTVDPYEEQAAYAIVSQPFGGGSPQFWTGSEWTQFEFRISATIAAGTQYTATAGGFVGSNGVSYGWQIYTWDNNAICSQAPFPFKITFATPPSVIVSVSSTSTSLPTISWTYTDANPQASYRVLIGPGGWDPLVDTPFLDSGVIAGPAGSWAVTEYLTEGQGYDAYVLVTDTLGATNGPIGPVGSTTVAAGSDGTNVNTFNGTEPLKVASVTAFTSSGRLRVIISSADNGIAYIYYTAKSSSPTVEFQDCTWDHGSAEGLLSTGDIVQEFGVPTPVSWTVSYTPIAAPTLVVTVPDDGSLFTLYANTSLVSGNNVEFQWSLDGITWADLRYGGITPVDGTDSATAYDAEGCGNSGLGNSGLGGAPLYGFETGVFYQCRQIDPLADQVSPWSNVVEVTWQQWTGYWWLKSVIGALSGQGLAQVQVQAPWVFPVTVVAAGYTELGAQFDVVVSDGARGAAGQITFVTITPPGSSGDYDALAEVLFPALNPDGSPRVLYLQSPYGDAMYIVITVADEYTLEFTDIGDPLYYIKCSFVQVARP